MLQSRSSLRDATNNMHRDEHKPAFRLKQRCVAFGLLLVLCIARLMPTHGATVDGSATQRQPASIPSGRRVVGETSDEMLDDESEKAHETKKKAQEDKETVGRLIRGGTELVGKRDMEYSDADEQNNVGAAGFWLPDDGTWSRQVVQDKLKDELVQEGNSGNGCGLDCVQLPDGRWVTKALFQAIVMTQLQSDTKSMENGHFEDFGGDTGSMERALQQADEEERSRTARSKAFRSSLDRFRKMDDMTTNSAGAWSSSIHEVDSSVLQTSSAHERNERSGGGGVAPDEEERQIRRRPGRDESTRPRVDVNSFSLSESEEELFETQPKEYESRGDGGFVAKADSFPETATTGNASEAPEETCRCQYPGERIYNSNWRNLATWQLFSGWVSSSSSSSSDEDKFVLVDGQVILPPNHPDCRHVRFACPGEVHNCEHWSCPLDLRRGLYELESDSVQNDSVDTGGRRGTQENLELTERMLKKSMGTKGGKKGKGSGPKGKKWSHKGKEGGPNGFNWNHKGKEGGPKGYSWSPKWDTGSSSSGADEDNYSNCQKIITLPNHHPLCGGDLTSTQDDTIQSNSPGSTSWINGAPKEGPTSPPTHGPTWVDPISQPTQLGLTPSEGPTLSPAAIPTTAPNANVIASLPIDLNVPTEGSPTSSPSSSPIASPVPILIPTASPAGPSSKTAAPLRRTAQPRTNSPSEGRLSNSPTILPTSAPLPITAAPLPITAAPLPITAAPLTLTAAPQDYPTSAPDLGTASKIPSSASSSSPAASPQGADEVPVFSPISLASAESPVFGDSPISSIAPITPVSDDSPESPVSGDSLISSDAPASANNNQGSGSNTVPSPTTESLSSPPSILSPDSWAASCEAALIDFEFLPDGTVLDPGDYVGMEWFESYGMAISVESWDGTYAPDGKGRIFDTSTPGIVDRDLGSPNMMCSPSGPGVGAGGEPGQIGENCLPQGNVLIIQEEDKKDPDDNGSGGNITFTFEPPAEVIHSIGIMDIKVGGSVVYAEDVGGATKEIVVAALGSNSIQDILIDERNVTRLTVSLYGSGAILFLSACMGGTQTTVSEPQIVTRESMPVVMKSEPLNGAVVEGEDHDRSLTSATLTGKDADLKCLDFSTSGNGNALFDGDYVRDEWFSIYGLTVTAHAKDGGYTPDGKVRIFDTSDPGTNDDNGDPDLGSPNIECSPPGPGFGNGGKPGMPGENCTPQGNVLIVQESDKVDPDDNAYGGNITFTFEHPPLEVVSIGLMDISEQGLDFIEVQTADGNGTVVLPIMGLGDNALQNERIATMNVKTLTVSFVRSGAIRHLCFYANRSPERDDSPKASDAMPLSPVHPTPSVSGRNDATHQPISSPSDVPARSAEGPSASPASSSTDQCESEKICIDFSFVPGSETKLMHGDYVSAEWFTEYGIFVSASSPDGGYTPGGQARIFDTTLYNTVDPDLGSPNANCAISGPGVGSGGLPGMPGANCNPSGEGNVLIIQESDKNEPDDNVYGGGITFISACPLERLLTVGLMNMNNIIGDYFEINTRNGKITQSLWGLGDNSVQEEKFDGITDVETVTVVAQNSLAIRHICFCRGNCSSSQATLQTNKPTKSVSETTSPIRKSSSESPNSWVPSEAPGASPDPSATGSKSQSPSASPDPNGTVSNTPSGSPAPSVTGSDRPSKSPTPSKGRTVSPSASPPPSSSGSVSGSLSSVVIAAESGIPGESPEPSSWPSRSRSPEPSLVHSESLSASQDAIGMGTNTPSGSPVPSVTGSDRLSKSPAPSRGPTVFPSASPAPSSNGSGLDGLSSAAIAAESRIPSENREPSSWPSRSQSPEPSLVHSEMPSVSSDPSGTVSNTPSGSPPPSVTGSVRPSKSPAPFRGPTVFPSASPAPSSNGSGLDGLSSAAITTESRIPSENREPSSWPSRSQSPEPSLVHSELPSVSPDPSGTASSTPSGSPIPSETRSDRPSKSPAPSKGPTVSPSASPAPSQDGSGFDGLSSAASATESGIPSGSPEPSTVETAPAIKNPSPAPSRSPEPSFAQSKSHSASPDPSGTASSTPSGSPIPSETGSDRPSKSPAPSKGPTVSPSASPAPSSNGSTSAGLSSAASTAESDIPSERPEPSSWPSPSQSRSPEPSLAHSESQNTSPDPSGTASNTPSASPAPSETGSDRVSMSPEPSMRSSGIANASPSTSPAPSASPMPSLARIRSSFPLFTSSLMWTPSLLPTASPNTGMGLSGSSRGKSFNSQMPAISCEYEVLTIDFESTPDGRELEGGDYVKYEWLSEYGITITAASLDGGYTPDGRARVFDTSSPGEEVDLGSPNERCSPSGPGVGEGGEPMREGENCVAQGNVLVIQEGNRPHADNNVYGGNLTFTFARSAAEVYTLGLMDVGGPLATVYVEKVDGSIIKIDVQGLGTNSVQNVTIGEESVKTLILALPTSGAVRFLSLCMDERSSAVHSSSPVPYSASTRYLLSPPSLFTIPSKVVHMNDADDSHSPLEQSRHEQLPNKHGCLGDVLSIDFEATPDGLTLVDGDLIKYEWFSSCGITIATVAMGTRFESPARILDTSSEGAALGSSLCNPGAGPGEGSNCMSQGNVLIIQDRDGRATAGNITFTFDPPAVKISTVGLMMDMKEGPRATVYVEKVDGTTVEKQVEDHSSIQNVTVHEEKVKKVTVVLAVPGAARLLTLCLPPADPFTILPMRELSPASSSTAPPPLSGDLPHHVPSHVPTKLPTVPPAKQPRALGQTKQPTKEMSPTVPTKESSHDLIWFPSSVPVIKTDNSPSRATPD